jgi:valyl-tRNA synthetase
MEVFVPLGDEVDLGALADTLERRLGKLSKGIEGVKKKLANEGFLRGADPEVVQAERERHDEMQLEIELLQRNLAGLR